MHEIWPQKTYFVGRHRRKEMTSKQKDFLLLKFVGFNGKCTSLTETLKEILR